MPRRRYLRLDPRLTTPDSFVSSDSAGGPVDPGARRDWLPALKRAGLEKRFHLHDLRHYATTALDEQGVGGKLRTEIIGHADERITNRVYTHVRRERTTRAAGDFDPLHGFAASDGS
jgi:integrase